MRARRIRLLAVAALLTFCVVTLIVALAWPQAVGDRVRLIDRAIGVPGHPSPI